MSTQPLVLPPARGIACPFRSGDGAQVGWLEKVTLAPQIAAGRKSFSRPVVRAFTTYANWSRGLRGSVDGAAFENHTRGLTYGVQAEAWW